MYRIVVRPGRTLWEELEQKNIVIDRPCGGKGTCGRCSVLLADGHQVLACQYQAPGIVEIEAFPELVQRVGADAQTSAENAGIRQFDAVGDTAVWRNPEQGVDRKHPVAVADIGTTTVVLTLFVGEHQVTRTFVNPQRQYGADVMSRIQAANGGHAGELQELIVRALAESLRDAWGELSGSSPKCPEDGGDGECTLVVSANTTMQHLLEGLSCARLGTAPFVPENLTLHEWRLPLEASAAESLRALRIVSLPGISAFVGADIVSGLAVIDILHGEHPQLLIDLGTNGEMALGCKDRLLVTSTAAGPAFEGSALAVRIHGAGILRLLHVLLERKIMDAYGTLCDEYFDAGYPVRLTEYGAKDAAPDETILLTQDEIRQLQMAKAAVFAGVETLLDVYGIAAEQVECVYLAGGFGYYLNPEDAVATGLLPECFQGRIRAAGNTSYAGAVAYAAEPEVFGARMDAVVSRAEAVSLPEQPEFEERYISAMNFPEDTAWTD